MFDWLIAAAIAVVVLVVFTLLVNDYQGRKRGQEERKALKRAVHRLQKEGDKRP